MKTFTKKYQVWQLAEGNQFSFDEFDTLAECIAAEKHGGSWYITKMVTLAVTEVGEAPIVAMPHMVRGFMGMNTNFGKVDEITDADKEYEKLQLGGPIAKLEG